MSRTTIAVVIAAIVLAGCGPTQDSSTSPSANPSVPMPQVSSDFVNRLDGSTATIPLGSAVMTALTGSDEGMEFNKTDAAYENLIKGDKDLILVTYPSEEEFQMASDAGVELDVIPVVKDALVFLANTGNTVDNLTQDQVRDIYTGKTTKWSDVGGSDDAIIPYQRQVNSGSQTLFLKLAMGDVTPMDAPTEMRPGEMSALVDMIADYDNSVDALGYSMFYYATQMYLKDTVKLLSIDGVAPSAQTISDETFPYLTYYYAVVRKDAPADSDARKVIEWMLGDEAQQLASRTNYVPMDPRNIQPPEPTYGYFGSTQDNTTRSSGTGGTQIKPLNWDQEITTQTCETDDHGNSTSCDYVSAEGKTMVLSDFFYDSMNYISYINQNLFNESTNPEYTRWLRGGELYMDGISHELPIGFTGIPNDYPDFVVEPYFSDGLLIQFYFPQGNPFMSETVEMDYTGQQYSTNMAAVGLRIPSDLSPYGRIASTIWKQNSSGQYYPVITTTSIPSAGDDTLNGKIQAQMTAHPDMMCFTTRYGAERLTLLGYIHPNQCTNRDEGSFGNPTVLGQWAFGTWDNDPMSVDDLPSTWRTDVNGINPFDGGMCSLQDENNCPGEFPDLTSFSSSATVRSVWADGNSLGAVVEDQGYAYTVMYG